MNRKNFISNERYLIVEVEKCIDGNAQNGYLFSSQVKIHDTADNCIVAEFKRYTHVIICRETGIETTKSTFDQILFNRMGLSNEDIHQFYDTNGVSKDFVVTAAI